MIIKLHSSFSRESPASAHARTLPIAAYMSPSSREPGDDSMAHVTVDLSLAVNYLPACACLKKMLVLMLVIWLIPAGEEVDCLITLAAML